MPYHGVSLSGINASRFKDYVIPPIKYLGVVSPPADGSTDVNAAEVFGIVTRFDQLTERLPESEATRLGIAIPTVTVTATPKGGDTQTLVEDTDFSTNGRQLFISKSVRLLPSTANQFVDALGFDGLAKDNVYDYFTNNNIFYINVTRPDITYTVTHSPNYFWNPPTGMRYDKEIVITFTTRPVQAAFTLTVKRDMIQELADADEIGIASLREDGNDCSINYRESKYNYVTVNTEKLAQRRTDATRVLYDHAMDKFSKYTVMNLSEWDSLGYADWYTGLPEGLRPAMAVYVGTTYAATGTSSTGKTYHYYDIHMEVW